MAASHGGGDLIAAIYDAVIDPSRPQKASYFEGVVTLLKIGCGFVGIRCYNHAAATTSRHVCRAEASARIASEVPCPTVHHQTKKP